MATKKLIYRNEREISQEVEAIEDVFPKLQNVCTEFSKITQNYDLNTFKTLKGKKEWNDLQHNNKTKTLEEYIQNSIIESMENPTIGGVVLKKEYLRNMIQLPDCFAL